MNKLVVPSSPNWYENKIIACAPDNTIIYGARQDIVVVSPRPKTEAAAVEVITYAHAGRIVTIDVNPGWSTGNKLAVSAGEDRLVKLWNVETNELIGSHNSHSTNTSKLVGAVFGGNGRIISVLANGTVALWQHSCKDVITLCLLIGKVEITTFSSCPHAPYITAFGLKDGLIIIADLRKSGKILHRMRSHDKAVTSLSWCPVPFNIFWKENNLSADALNRKKIEKQSLKIEDECSETNNEPSQNSLAETDSASCVGETVLDDKLLENIDNSKKIEVKELYNVLKKVQLPEGIKKNPWVNLKHVDDDEIDDVSPQTVLDIPVKDFLSECEDLKRRILSKDDHDTSLDKCPLNLEESPDNLPHHEVPSPETEVIKDCVILEKKTLENITTPQHITEDSVNNSSLQSLSVVQDDKLEKNILEAICETDSLICSGKVTSTNEVCNESQPEKEYLLASSSYGTHICIWRTYANGGLQLELKSSSYGRRKNDNRSTDKQWTSVCWLTHDILLSSNSVGALLKWDLLKRSKTGKSIQNTIVHQDHRNNIFSIAAPIKIFSDWKDRDSFDKTLLHAWTVGHDRQLLDTSLDGGCPNLTSYLTIGGFIHCITNSPLDPHRVAIGIGDNTIALWDLSRPHIQTVSMTSIWHKIQSKVFILAWHPVDEMVLAYGTQEGRVGLIRTNNAAKSSTLLTNFMKFGIHKLEWGPIQDNAKICGLYICSGGDIFIFNTENQSNVSSKMEIPENEHITEISWKEDYSLLAMGSKSSSILVYDSKLKHLFTIYTQHKVVHCICWHPEGTDEDTSISPFANYLAVGTSDSSVIICDLSTSDKKYDGNTTNRIVSVLSGHVKPVRCMFWSCYENGKLVSCGEDGIAQKMCTSENCIFITPNKQCFIIENKYLPCLYNYQMWYTC